MARVWIVAVMFRDELGRVVGVVDAWAGSMARESSKRVLRGPAVVKLWTTKAAGQQIR